MILGISTYFLKEFINIYTEATHRQKDFVIAKAQHERKHLLIIVTMAGRLDDNS